MDKLDKLLVLEEFFSQVVWFLDFGPSLRVVGASIKVEPTGYLLVLRAKSAEGPQVAFVGARTLDKLRTEVLDRAGSERLKWREDRY